MQTSFRLFAGAIVLGLSATAMAHSDDARPAHFKGEPAATTEQALANLSEYNNKLEAVLSKNELTAADLHEVHQLTYTLENALERLQTDLTATAEVLEEVHVASETNDAATVKQRGADYLQATGKLTK